MKEHLGKIAVAGLAIGIAAFGLGYALEGSGRMEFSDRHRSKDLACLDATVAGDASTKNWAWDDADTITIAVPGTLHYRGGDGDQLVVRGPQEALAHIRVHGGKIETDCRGSAPNWRSPCRGGHSEALRWPVRAGSRWKTSISRS